MSIILNYFEKSMILAEVYPHFMFSVII